VKGKNGITLKEVWEDPFPEAYCSIFAKDMPNYMIFLGPNGAPPSGSTVLGESILQNTLFLKLPIYRINL
jgi:hypothetical protein